LEIDATILGMPKLPNLFVLIGLVILLLIATSAEVLDWIGRLEIIEKRWPRIWAAINNRPLRLIFYLFFIVALGEDAAERIKEAHEVPPLVVTFVAPKSPDVTFVQPEPPKETGRPPKQSEPPPPQAIFSYLAINQTDKVSTRPDAKYQIELNVTSTKVLPSATIRVSCNAPIAGVRFIDYTRSYIVQTFTPEEVVIDPKTHKSFAFGYSQLVPGFGPSLPLTFEVWANQPITCDHVESF
jgi:hypothetical protein